MWGVSQFSVKNVLSHSAEKHRKGILLCFRTFLLWNNCLDKRVGRGWSITIFRQKYFLAQWSKTFVGETFSVSLISGIEKVYA